jgi:HEAT repeat protein
VRVLIQVEHHDARVYTRGLRHVQLEPVFGGREDVAGPLRGHSALGLVRAQHRDAPLELAALLADPIPSARAAAAQVLGEIDPAVAVPLLRFKVLSGDPEIEVIGACLSALLVAGRELSVPFVAARLEKSPALAEAAALALGESRLAAAFEPLAELTAKGPTEVRAVGFLALALLRTDRAWEHLLDVVATGSFVDARDAATALATFRHDAKLVERLRAAAARNDRRVAKAVAKALAVAAVPRVSRR